MIDNPALTVGHGPRLAQSVASGRAGTNFLRFPRGAVDGSEGNGHEESGGGSKATELREGGETTSRKPID